MQPITESTPEEVHLMKSEENQMNTKDDYNRPMQLNEQTFKDESIVSKMNNVLKFNPFKIFIVFFLVIMVYIIACEMIQYGFTELQNILKDVDGHHRMFKSICGTMIIFLGVIAIYCLIIFLGGTFLYLVDNFIPLCIRYYYVGRRESYRWWQTEFAITCIVKSLAIILWIFFALELVQLLLFDFAWNDMSNDRLTVYRISGLLILTLLSIVVFVGVVSKKDSSYSMTKRGKIQ